MIVSKARLPAEWEPQAATLLAWPHADTDWASQLARVQSFYVDLINATLAYQPVVLLVDCAGSESVVRSAITQQAHPLITIEAQYNDTWVRDFGPLTVCDGESVKFVDYRFDGWGGKFLASDDDRATAVIADKLQLPIQHIDQVLEGGAVDSDGRGHILTTEQCLLLRHQGLQQRAVERMLEPLGSKRVLWLGQAQLVGDDTDGHIDTLARFVNEDTIAYVKSPEGDEHYPALTAMEHELQALSNIDGQPYRLLPIPLPDPVYDGNERLAATHLNFMLVNGAAFIPTFGGDSDHHALEQFGKIWPDREIIALNCRPIVWQGGCVHCISMNLPAALRPWLDNYQSQ